MTTDQSHCNCHCCNANRKIQWNGNLVDHISDNMQIRKLIHPISIALGNPVAKADLLNNDENSMSPSFCLSFCILFCSQMSYIFFLQMIDNVIRCAQIFFGGAVL